MHRRMTASCPRKAGMDGTSDAATRAFRLNSAQSVAPLPCPCSPRGSSSPPPAPTTPQGPNPSSRASPHEDVYPEFSPPRPSTVSCQLRLLRVSWNPMHVLSLRLRFQTFGCNRPDRPRRRRTQSNHPNRTPISKHPQAAPSQVISKLPQTTKAKQAPSCASAAMSLASHPEEAFSLFTSN